MMEAVPSFLALNVMEMILPFDPEYPGVGKPPLNVIWPSEFEKLGSSTHKENIEGLLLIDITSSMSEGKRIVPSELFIAWSPVSTKTLTDTMLPTDTCACVGTI
jgi:hypothetical protein